MKRFFAGLSLLGMAFVLPASILSYSVKAHEVSAAKTLNWFNMSHTDITPAVNQYVNVYSYSYWWNTTLGSTPPVENYLSTSAAMVYTYSPTFFDSFVLSTVDSVLAQERSSHNWNDWGRRSDDFLMYVFFANYTYADSNNQLNNLSEIICINAGALSYYCDTRVLYGAGQSYSFRFSAPFNDVVYSYIHNNPEVDYLPYLDLGQYAYTDTIYGLSSSITSSFGYFFDGYGYDDEYKAFLANLDRRGSEVASSVYPEAYSEGYSDGREDGYNSGYSQGYSNGYNSGVMDGYENGYHNGEAVGYQDGLNDGSPTMINLWGLIGTVVSMPFTFLTASLDVTLFEGTSYAFYVGGFFYSIFIILLVWKIIGLILGRK